MKLHDLDWDEVLAQLHRWEALSPEGRMAFLEIRTGMKVPGQVLASAGMELVEAGLLHPPAGRGTLYLLDPALRTLLVALRAAGRLRPLHGHRGVLPVAYLQDQITNRQAHLLANPGGGYLSPGDRQAAAERASSVDWARGFLDAAATERVDAWEAARLPPEDEPRLNRPSVTAALRALVEALAERPGGVLLREVGALLGPAHRAALPDALAAAHRYLLAFVSLEPESAAATVGLLPQVARRLGPPPAPPAPLEAAERFHLAYRIADMTTLLVEAAGEPIPVRVSDGSLFARSRAAVAARLAHRPGWVVGFLGQGPEEEDAESLDGRVREAAGMLVALGLAKVRQGGERVRFEPTRHGRAWLAGSEGERTREVLDRFRASRDREPLQWAGPTDLDFFGTRLGFAVEAKKLDLRARLQEAFLAVPGDALLPLREFVVHHAECRNPFLGPDGPVLSDRYGWGRPRTREGWEAAWGDTLASFLLRRLLPLGGATLGRSAKGGTLFGVTAAGRYLLGGTGELELPETRAEVVVQPDFEVVFLAPAPAAEAELARFAERTGSGVGALFRITRASVLRAAEQGMRADGLLRVLGGLSRTPVPGNVAAQVRGWMDAARRVRIAPALLVECPDAETAAQVRSLGGAAVSAVTGTLLRVDGDRKLVGALVKKLRGRGIFVDGG